MQKKLVTVFIPCLVDQCFPEMGIAFVNLLNFFGFTTKYSDKVTCCGQPAFNAGHTKEAKSVACNFISKIDYSNTVVTISGSCTAMIRNFYNTLAIDKLPVGLSLNILEFSEFLFREIKTLKPANKEFKERIAFHNSCHSLRELGIVDLPEKIIKRLVGAEIINSSAENTCCGFGGLFCVKFPDIAKGMSKSRLDYFINCSSDRIVSNDPGCIMHLRKEANDRNIKLPIQHLSEFLAEAYNLPTNKFIKTING